MNREDLSRSYLELSEKENPETGSRKKYVLKDELASPSQGSQENFGQLQSGSDTRPQGESFEITRSQESGLAPEDEEIMRALQKKIKERKEKEKQQLAAARQDLSDGQANSSGSGGGRSHESGGRGSRERGLQGSRESSRGGYSESRRPEQKDNQSEYYKLKIRGLELKNKRLEQEVGESEEKIYLKNLPNIEFFSDDNLEKLFTFNPKLSKIFTNEEYKGNIHVEVVVGTNGWGSNYYNIFETNTVKAEQRLEGAVHDAINEIKIKQNPNTSDLHILDQFNIQRVLMEPVNDNVDEWKLRIYIWYPMSWGQKLWRSIRGRPVFNVYPINSPEYLRKRYVEVHPIDRDVYKLWGNNE